MTEQRRWLLFFLLSLIVIQTFWILSPKPKKPVTPPGRTTAGETTGTATGLATAAPGTVTTATATAEVPALAGNVEGTSVARAQRPGPATTLRTDKYAIEFDSVGAVVRSLHLLDPGSASYKRSVDQPTTGIELVRTLPTHDPMQVLPLEVSLADQGGNRGVFEEFNHVQWESKVLQPGGKGKDAIVQFTSPVIRGLRLQKTLTLPYDSYFPTLQVKVFNDSPNRVTISDTLAGEAVGLSLRWGPGLVERAPGESADAEAAYDTALVRLNGSVQVFTPSLGKEPVERTGALEWGGVESKFFAALLTPVQADDASKRGVYGFRALVPGSHAAEGIKGYHPPAVVEVATPRFDLEPKSSRTFDFGLYMGPKKYTVLGKYDHALQSAMFPNSWPFMRAIYLGLTDFLNFLYTFVHNYGIAIILLTMIVRLLVFPLTQKQIKIQARTMAEMAKVKPHLDAINEKYKNDRVERDKRIWEVYKEHNISPLAPLRGCLPLLLQMPIFIGLYRVANDTIDLQGANFLWIKDLSQPDHLFHLGFSLPIIGEWFNLLPLIMGASQVISTRLGMKRATNMDPTQKQMMYYMPLILTFTLYRLPAGLMVYWCTSNIWQIFQTMLTNQMMEKEEARHKQGAAAAEFEAQKNKPSAGESKGKSVTSLPDDDKKK